MENYDDLTIPELKELCFDRKIEVPSNAKHDEIVKILENDDKKPDPKHKKEEAKREESVELDSLGIPLKPAGKEETYLLEPTPGKKEWLTKGEAKEKGFQVQEKAKA